MQKEVEAEVQIAEGAENLNHTDIRSKQIRES